MALLFMDSVSHYTTPTDKWDTANNVIVSASNPRMPGRSSLKSTGFYAFARRLGSIQYGTLICGQAMRLSSGSCPLFCFFDGSTPQVTLNNSVNMEVVARRGAGDGAILGTSTTFVVPLSTWFHIEAKVVFHSSAGSIQVRINNSTVLNLSGINTSATGHAYATGYGWGSSSSINDNVFDNYYCDFYACDTSGSANIDFLGDLRVDYLVPTGAGIRTLFTPSAGSNWQNVDVIPASDADYNSSNVPGAMDLFTMADLTRNGLVRGVQTITRARKDDAGFRKAEPVFYKASGLGSTARFYKGSNSPVPDNFSNLPTQVFNTSPDTGVAWTIDEVNALQYGYAVGDAGMFTLDAKLV